MYTVKTLQSVFSDPISLLCFAFIAAPALWMPVSYRQSSMAPALSWPLPALTFPSLGCLQQESGSHCGQSFPPSFHSQPGNARVLPQHFLNLSPFPYF